MSAWSFNAPSSEIFTDFHRTGAKRGGIYQDAGKPAVGLPVGGLRHELKPGHSLQSINVKRSDALPRCNALR